MITDYTSNILLRNTIELLSGHEFRAPINGIVGYSEFLQNDAFELLEEDRKAFARNIHLSAKRLIQLSERLNVWYSLFSGQAPERKSAFQLSAGDFESIILEEAEHCSIDRFVIRFSSNMDHCMVRGTKPMFEIAMKELVQNAFRYSMKNEIVSFSIMKVKNEVVVQISNTSVSATVEELKTYTVFTRFHRKGSGEQGLGLGMEIARLCIAKCGGYMKIHRDASPEDNRQVVFEVSLRKEYLDAEE